MKMTPGQFIEYIRTNYNVTTQSETARQLGVSQGHISNYVKGKSYPLFEQAAKWYREYGVQLHRFTEEALQEEVERNEALQASINNS